MPSSLRRLALPLAAAGLLVAAAGEPDLTNEEKEHFLLTAEIVAARPLPKGKTHPWRLTLTDGRITHDAVFQSIDERRDRYETADGRTEFFFVDSYRYNIAAYRLAGLLGLDDMIPVTVERSWRGERGSLAWWIEHRWDGTAVYKEGLVPPDIVAFNRQMYKIRVFGQLVYDTDRNLTNLLITEDWKLYMIDFTRAFRRWKRLPDPDELTHCERRLFESLKRLRQEDVEARCRPWLTIFEIRALMARRDLLVEHFEKRIAELGEGAVLY